MIDSSLNKAENIICHCTSTTQCAIEKLIINDYTLQQIINFTGVTTGCGACEYNIEQLFNAQKKQ